MKPQCNSSQCIRKSGSRDAYSEMQSMQRGCISDAINKLRNPDAVCDVDSTETTTGLVSSQRGRSGILFAAADATQN